MSPTITKTANPSQPQANGTMSPAEMPAPSLVNDIPVHNPNPTSIQPDEDAELDQIMQDVGREMHKIDNSTKKHRFWDLNRQPKKSAVFSTQTRQSKTAPNPAPPAPARQARPPAATKPAAAAHPDPARHPQPKPANQKPPKLPKQPKQHRIPLTVTLLTAIVTAALIAVAYRAYK